MMMNPLSTAVSTILLVLFSFWTCRNNNATALLLVPPSSPSITLRQVKPSSSSSSALSLVSSAASACFIQHHQKQQQQQQQQHSRNQISSLLLLFSSLDDDPELDDKDDEAEKYTFAPKSDREAFVSEAETAQQANAIAATLTATISNSNNNIELQQEISNSFLQYALSIILGRAIPDARDGLKPVHRRILYAMHQLKLSPTTPHRKCARVVGEVLGKFHPHGDMAVYDALVRLAQDFSTHYPLIDGHGNFGSIDADPAAAMRYTEARLTTLSQAALLEDLALDTVDFVPNFDGNEVEPIVLPAKLPILLLNGASGIAVGMATNIPPHNLKEIMTACIALVQARQTNKSSDDNNNKNSKPVTDKRLFQLVPGPDFPTGACIMGTRGAQQLYQTSNGGIVMRAVTKIEQLMAGSSSSSSSNSSSKQHKKGQSTRTAIVVTELPYQVNKASLLEKIASLVNEKKLDGIADLRDESDRDGIRVVIELKRDAVTSVVLNNLYKKTALQTTFSGNFLALMNKGASGSLVPQRFSLREALDWFLDFRFETMRRKSRFQLSKVESRATIVDGLLIALENVDQVIDIVRAAENQQAARQLLQDNLGTTEDQTDAILRLQLGQLTRLNKGNLQDEKTTLEKSRAELTTLLADDNAVYDYLTTEFKELINKFGTDRKTRILAEDDGDLDEIDLIENSRSVIVVTRGGYIKRMPLKTFESQRRGTRGKRGTFDSGESSDNEVVHCFTCNDHDTLLMVTQKGIAYGVRAYQVPVGARTAKGQPIPSVLPVRSDDVITAILPVSDFSKDEYLVLATEQGFIKKTALSAFANLTSRSLAIALLAENDRLQWCQDCRDGDDILIATAKGMATRFEAAKLRPTGRNSRGVKSIKLKEGDKIADVNVLSGSSSSNTDPGEYVLMVTSRGFGKKTKTSEFRTQTRGGQGIIALKFKKGQEDDSVSCFRRVKDDDEILLITTRGIMVRQSVSEVPTQSRSATGVLIQKLDPGDMISSVSIVPEYEESDS